MSSLPLTNDMKPGTNENLSLDAICSLLGDTHRRAVLSELEPDDHRIALETLALALAANPEYDLPEDPQAIAVALHHCHLPKLDAADAITYDHDALELSPADTFETLRDHLPLTP